MRRVHEPDNAIIERRAKPHRLDEPRRFRFGKSLDPRDLRRPARMILAEIDPDIALRLAGRVARHAHRREIELLTLGERRDGGAPPVRHKAPAVIAAFDLAAVELAGRERHAAVWADVAQREDGAALVTPDHDRLAQHDAGEQPARPQLPPGHGVIPGLAQRRCRILHARTLARHAATYRGPLPAA